MCVVKHSDQYICSIVLYCLLLMDGLKMAKYNVGNCEEESYHPFLFTGAFCLLFRSRRGNEAALNPVTLMTR